MTCRHFPDQLKLGRGQGHDSTGPISVTVECQCGARWSFDHGERIKSKQELAAYINDILITPVEPGTVLT